MQLDSYLEIFTTMYGWAFANILGEIITGTGIIVLPFALIVFNGFKDAKENGIGASGGVMGVIESVQTKLIIAMFVLSVCFATTPATSLMSINLSYTPPASASDGSPQTGSRDGGTNSGFDRAMADATNGNMSPTGSLYYVPAWWFTAMAISSGINNAARDGLRSAGRDIRMVEDMARTATIEDPRLLSDIQRFYSECFIPARSRYLQLGPDELSGSGRAIVADTNKDYGPTDVDWMGSQLFRKEPGFYDTMRSYNPVTGFAIDASRDKDFERTAPVGSPEASFILPQWGRPTCNQWWESSNGLRSRMVDHSATWRKLTTAAADAFSWTSDDQRLDAFAKLAQTKANPHMVDTDRIMGNDYDTVTKIGRTFTGAASTVGLERLTKRGNRANADDTASQGKQREMNIDATLEACTQLAEGSQPGVSALDDPAVATEPIIALDASAGDAILDASALEVSTASRVVVTLVRMQFSGPAARPSPLAAHRRQGVDQFVEDHRIVTVGPSDAEDQRDALAVRDEVALAAKLAPVRGVGPRVRAPRGLGTLAPSMLTRLKSSLSALRNSASSNRCSRCHTPAACQSRSRRQHVMPLPKPNSWGSSSQGMPVRSTKRMPLRACSSLSRGRPPLAEGVTTGSNGAICLYSAAPISLFLIRPIARQTHTSRLAIIWFC